jgi:hypothetical protein
MTINRLTMIQNAVIRLNGLGESRLTDNKMFQLDFNNDEFALDT